ncbi:hypothetical protein VTJ83DRAFT_3275 [Remersonia thermophila]|uniref:Protein kinase domain-containing protein n=1 Tax=Remersonia thermophila TaxID=72144 RepID=A0ABR4DEG4_9PEZI
MEAGPFSMSLVPYHPREGREIVLRHHNAIVVRDPSSQRLELRSLQLHECPTCRRPLRSPSPERHYDAARHDDTYVDPNYFRMLRAGHNAVNAPAPRPSTSPVRRHLEPLPAAVHDAPEDGRDDGHDEHASSPSARGSMPPPSPAPPRTGGRIRRESFSPNYFNTFFVEEKELGRGGKGVVLLVRHHIDGCNLGHFACKRVPVGDDHAWLEKVLVEVELLANLAHPNLVSYRHVWLEDVQLTRFGPSVVCAFILQQYCNGGDLLRYVIGDAPKEVTKEELKARMRRRSRGPTSERPQLHKRLSAEEIYSLFKDVTSGLAYLHASNYIHRDLKPSNCLLHRDGHQLKCLISDFGEVQPENAIRSSTGSTGTISYCAPEVLKRDATGRYGNFTTKSDMFSLGMILYFMCFGRLPYANANSANEELEDIDQLRAEITDWKGFQAEKKLRPDLPPKLYHLLSRLLAVNPAERPSASEVLSAMANEPLDSMARGPRIASPLFGLGSQRIQNLDSPVPPGTPIPEPTKHARVGGGVCDDAGRPESARDARPATPPSNTLVSRLSASASGSQKRVQAGAHAMALSRSRRSHNSSPDRGPSRSPQRSRDLAAPVSPATSATPLLMPPPTTRAARVRHGVVLVQYRAAHWVRAHAASLRLVLFVAKMLSLSWVCWPYSAGWPVTAAAVLLAFWDLHGRAEKTAVAGGPRPPLTPTMATTSGFATEPGLAARDQHDGVAGAGTSPWRGVWQRSIVLLALHILLVGTALKFGGMCAGGPGRRGWEKW